MRGLPVFLVAAFLAGCLGGDETADAPLPDAASDDPVNGTAKPRVVDASGTIVAGGGTPVVSFVNGAEAGVLTVTSNVTLLHVELRWESPVVALDLCVHAPSDGYTTDDVPICGVREDGGAPGMPTNLVTYTVRAPEAGDDWQVSPYPDGPAADQAFELKATLFHGETTLPAGYSALS